MDGLPAEFVRRVNGVHGKAGADWLARLPELVSACAAAWSLRLGEPAALSYHYVVHATRTDGEACVLKLGVPGDVELEREAAVLGALDGHGAVRLRAHDAARGALLLERAAPGRPLAELVPADDDAATRAAASVLQRLWRPPPRELAVPELAGLAAGFRRYHDRYRTAGPLPRALVADAERLFRDLAGSADRSVLLHGDLHHGNVLSSRRDRWLAIDPKGLAGDPAYDCAPLLHNPHEPARLSGRLALLAPRRLDRLAGELGLDRGRVAGWGFAHAVLSELWSVEDHGAPHGTPLAVAEALRHELP